MLKEELYLQYQSMFRDYKEKRKKVESLETELAGIPTEKKQKISSLSNEKTAKLDQISQNRAALERQLESVKKDGMNSPAVKKYSEQRLLDIHNCMENIKGLEQSQKRELEKINNKSRNTLREYESSKAEFQKRLGYLDGSAGLKTDTDQSIEKVQKSLNDIDEDYNTILRNEQSYIKDDPKLSVILESLEHKAAIGELPDSIKSALNTPVEDFIYKWKISSGKKLAEIAQDASSLDDLKRYTPKWLYPFVKYAIPVIVLLLLIFILSVTEVGMSTLYVCLFLISIWTAKICFTVRFNSVSITKGKTRGIISGIIACILGAIAAFFITLIFLSIIENLSWFKFEYLIIRTVICSMAPLGIYYLNSHTKLGNILVSLLMKIPFIKKGALAQQEVIVKGKEDSYYALIRYKEIIACVVEKNKNDRNSFLNSEIQRLQQEHIQMQEDCAAEIAGYDDKIRREKEESEEQAERTERIYDSKIASEKARLEQLQEGLASDKDSLLKQIESDIEKNKKVYLETSAEYDRMISECEEEFRKRSERVSADIAKLNSELSPDLDALHSAFNIIDTKTVGFEESCGVLSDSIYIYNENSDEDPKSITEINHCKRPIVFLYDLKDPASVTDSLFLFIRAVLGGFYSINAADALEAVITDPVSKGRPFQTMTKFLTIEDDIKKISVSVQDLMSSAAKTGMSVDKYNKKMSDEGEDKVKFLRYKIIQFIVPEEAAAQNTNFFDSDLWGTLGDGWKHGFIPIFYISYSDWENTFDSSSKLNSRFIIQLKKAIDQSNGSIYKIDEKKITIRKL